MSKVRKSYSSDEKAKIVLEMIKGKLTQAEISSKYSVHATQLHLWHQQFKGGLCDIFRDKRR